MKTANTYLIRNIYLNLSNYSIILILFLIIFIGILEINQGVVLNNNTATVTPVSENINTKTVSPNLQEINAKFEEIRDIPYNEQSMNCVHKSKLFADYLVQMGEKNVYLVTIPHESGKYSHQFVEWNGHYYDACNTHDLSYLVSKEDYLNNLHEKGFNGIIIQSSYV